MIRNLKALLVAALALTALGAIATSAHAADEFHCSVTPCRGTLATDGGAKNAHHVFIVENEATSKSVSFTCESLRGTSKTSNRLKQRWQERLTAAALPMGVRVGLSK